MASASNLDDRPDVRTLLEMILARIDLLTQEVRALAQDRSPDALEAGVFRAINDRAGGGKRWRPGEVVAWARNPLSSSAALAKALDAVLDMDTERPDQALGRWLAKRIGQEHADLRLEVAGRGLYRFDVVSVVSASETTSAATSWPSIRGRKPR